jgi:hypothetical protein
MVNLLLVYATHDDYFTMARLAIRNRTINEDTCLMLPTRSAHAQLGEYGCLSIFASRIIA